MSEQSIQILGLVSVDPAPFPYVPPAVLWVLYERCTADHPPVKRNVQSASDEFDGILSHGLVEIGVELLWRS
jgi:hypothetical protein